MAWCDIDDQPLLSEPVMVILWTHICITQPLWVNSSPPPSVAYIRQWTWSALVQIMACRLIGAKPLSGPMLDIVNWTLRNKLQWNFNQSTKLFIHEIALEYVVWELGGDELTRAEVVLCQFPGSRHSLCLLTDGYMIPKILYFVSPTHIHSLFVNASLSSFPGGEPPIVLLLITRTSYCSPAQHQSIFCHHTA